MPWDKTQNLAGPQGPAGTPADTSAFIKIAGDTMQGPLVVPNATAGTQALNANTADTAYLRGYTAATSTGVGDVQYAAESGLLTGIKMRQFAIYGSTNNDGVFYGATTGFSGAALITVCPVIAVGGLLFSTYLYNISYDYFSGFINYYNTAYPASGWIPYTGWICIQGMAPVAATAISKDGNIIEPTITIQDFSHLPPKPAPDPNFLSTLKRI